MLRENCRSIATSGPFEYNEIAKIILSLTEPRESLKNAGNLEVWQAMFGPNVELPHLPQRCRTRALHVVIRLYISIDNGECGAERDLGTLVAFIHEHKLRKNSLVDDLMVWRSEPQVIPLNVSRYSQAIGCVRKSVHGGYGGRHCGER